jgi:uncharacterized membrane protein YhaH (DUF805 family)
MPVERSPIEWAKLPLQKYVDFKGRAPRAEYWWYTLAVIVAAIIVTVIEGMLGLGASVGPYGPVSLILMLALLLPGLGVTVRRLHDTNRSGWWLLVAVIPYVILGFMMAGAAASGDMAGLATAGLFSLVALVGAIVLLVFMVLPGTRGPNNYGPDPYSADVEQVFA